MTTAPAWCSGSTSTPTTPRDREAALAAVHGVLDIVAPDFAVDVVFTSERDEFTDWMSAHAEPFFLAKRGWAARWSRGGSG